MSATSPTHAHQWPPCGPVATSIFVDDQLGGSTQGPEVAAVERKACVHLLEYFGLTEHPTKGQRTPSKTIELHLGFGVNTEKMGRWTYPLAKLRALGGMARRL